MLASAPAAMYTTYSPARRLADMKADGGQVRDVVFRVRGRAVTSKTGAWSQVVAQNPQLKALTGIKIEEGLNQAFFKCNTPDEEDFAGLQAWVSTNAACPTIAANLAYDGADTFIALNVVAPFLISQCYNL